jgi:hypothetical protein
MQGVSATKSGRQYKIHSKYFLISDAVIIDPILVENKKISVILFAVFQILI